MYQVILRKEAGKSLAKIDRRFILKIQTAINILQFDPYLGKALEGDMKGKYSIRVWPYRIIYEIYQGKLLILVLAIKHRQNAYK